MLGLKSHHESEEIETKKGILIQPSDQEDQGPSPGTDTVLFIERGSSR